MDVEVAPSLLVWARERARIDLADLAVRFPLLPQWELGTTLPSFNQLQAYAKVTHAPIGFFFLAEPPIEKLPIPDFRTASNAQIQRASVDLLETIYLCQQRQEWYRDFARGEARKPLRFVASLSTNTDISQAAASMRDALSFDLEERRQSSTWTDALRLFVEQAEKLGVLVMINGVVGNITKRRLDPQEFRGFALADDLAPLVFINGADTKAAQMFTLAHELAHIWLGRTGLDDTGVHSVAHDEIEKWCNKVAGELLVPAAHLHKHFRPANELRSELDRLARQFKVSTIVVLRQLYETTIISRDAFWNAYEAELSRLTKVRRTSGGNFYSTQSARVGKRFGRDLINSTLEGQTLYRDALKLLNYKKVSTLNKLGRSFGIEIVE